MAAPVAAPRPVAAPVAAPAAVAAPVAAPATVAVPVTAPMTVAAPVAAPATAAGPESVPWHAATAADLYGGGMDLGELRTQDEALVELGFSSEEERTEIRRWVMEIGRQVHVKEIFSPPRATKMAHRFGLTPGMAFDLSVGWDLDREEDQREVWRHLVEEQPYLVIGSLECIGFSTMQRLSAGKPGAAASRETGLRHLDFVAKVYQWQWERGGLFLHGHPWHADSWSVPAVKQIVALEGVVCAYGDQCPFGQKVKYDDGREELVRKPTGWLTNSQRIADALSRACTGDHAHGSVFNGRPQQVAVYPPKLVAAILRALRDELRSAGRLAEFEAGPTVEEEPPETAWAQEPEFWDEISGATLGAEEVFAARKLEVEHMQGMDVYEEAAWEEMAADGVTKPIPTGWIDTNKDDEGNRNIRSRAVVQETMGRSTMGTSMAETFAATPPL